MFLFDTDVLSELTRPKPNVGLVRKLLTCAPGLRFASEMTRYELRYGAVLHPRGDALWARIESEILPRCAWLPIDSIVSIRTADMSARLRLAGQTIDWADLVIAATASVHDLIVVTRSVRHFERIPGLQVENWFPVE